MHGQWVSQEGKLKYNDVCAYECLNNIIKTMCVVKTYFLSTYSAVFSNDVDAMKPNGV